MSSPDPNLEPIEKHQLAGLDPQERGFNRPVVLEPREGGYCAVLRYEGVRVMAGADSSQALALRALIGHLQGQGYRQLRTQLSFRGFEYLGSREPWVEYPEPVLPTEGWWAHLKRWFEPTATKPSSDRHA